MPDRSFAAYYESLPKESQWSSEDRGQIGLFIGHCLANEISFPKNPKGKTIIFSSSSNVGVMEKGIQDEAGDNYLVIASDYANLPRSEGTIPLQSDARALPIVDNSIPCLLDIKGALWHELADDQFHPEIDKASKIIEHYRSKLTQDGVLVIDDGYETSTGTFLDKIFKGNIIIGFDKPEFIGEEPFILRIYRKVNQEP